MVQNEFQYSLMPIKKYIGISEIVYRRQRRSTDETPISAVRQDGDEEIFDVVLIDSEQRILTARNG